MGLILTLLARANLGRGNQFKWEKLGIGGDGFIGVGFIESDHTAKDLWDFGPDSSSPVMKIGRPRISQGTIPLMSPMKYLTGEGAAFYGKPAIGAEANARKDFDVIDRIGDIVPSVFRHAFLPAQKIVSNVIPSFLRKQDDGAKRGGGEF